MGAPRGKRSRTELYSKLLTDLDQTALDPAAWTLVCDDLAAIVGGVGSVLVQADDKHGGPALPHSKSLAESFRLYVDAGWHKRNPRALEGFPKAIRFGYAVDQDLISREAMRRHPYYAEFLAPLGLQWFAAVTFPVNGRHWAACVQGTPRRGPFLTEDVEQLIQLRGALGLAAKRSAALGRQRLESLETAFAPAGRGVLALDAGGRISWLNGAAESMLRDAELVSEGHLSSRDPFHQTRLAELIHGTLRFEWSPRVKLAAPVRVRTAAGCKFSVDAVPMPRDFQALLSGVTVLVTIHEVEATPRRSPAADLRRRYHLTQREAQLASLLKSGADLFEAAAALGMTVATARSHLKVIFAKTHTNRQGQLVALLSRDEDRPP